MKLEQKRNFEALLGDTFGFVGETARHFFPTMLRVNFLYLLVVAVRRRGFPVQDARDDRLVGLGRTGHGDELASGFGLVGDGVDGALRFVAAGGGSDLRSLYSGLHDPVPG